MTNPVVDSIGPEGGTLEGNSGETLEVPPGVLEAVVELGIGQVQDATSLPALPAGMIAVSEYFGVLPHDPILDGTATITLPFTGSDTTGLVILRAVPGGTWQQLDASTSGNEASAETGSFGYFVVVVPEGGSGGTGGTGGGGTGGTGGVNDPNCETDGVSTEAEPNDASGDATRLSSGTTVAGAIDAVGDVDWYYLSACGESVVTVELSAPALSAVALQATSATAGTPITGYIASRDDEDWYEVQVTGPGDLSVTLSTSEGTDVDYRVWLYDESTTEQWEGYEPSSTSAISIVQASPTAVPAGAQTYRVRVYDSDNDDWDLDTSYELTLTFAP